MSCPSHSRTHSAAVTSHGPSCASEGTRDGCRTCHSRGSGKQSKETEGLGKGKLRVQLTTIYRKDASEESPFPWNSTRTTFFLLRFTSLQGNKNKEQDKRGNYSTKLVVKCEASGGGERGDRFSSRHESQHGTNCSTTGFLNCSSLTNQNHHKRVSVKSKKISKGQSEPF